MKKRILALVLLAGLLLSLCSCDLFFGKVEDSGSVTVVIENADGSHEVFEVDLMSVENKSEGAKGLLEHLSQREDRLYVEMIDSTYGAYVEAIGNLRQDSFAGKYIVVYTSVATDGYEGGSTIDYEGKELYMSGVGLSGMNIEAGTIILFRLEKSPY